MSTQDNKNANVSETKDPFLTSVYGFDKETNTFKTRTFTEMVEYFSAENGVKPLEIFYRAGVPQRNWNRYKNEQRTPDRRTLMLDAKNRDRLLESSPVFYAKLGSAGGAFDNLVMKYYDDIVAEFKTTKNIYSSNKKAIELDNQLCELGLEPLFSEEE